MITDEVMAQIAESDHADAERILRRLGSRIGIGELRMLCFSSVLSAASVAESRPQLLRAGEFLRQVGTPPPMLVDQLLPDKSLVLISGKPKAGKSFLGLDIMDAVCEGCPVLGEFTVNRPGPCIYLGMEDGQYEIANRLLKRGMKPDDQRPLHVCVSRFNITTPEALAELERMAAEVQPVLIVVDTAREALGIRDWNDAAQVSDAIRPIREFARAHCTVILIAHNRKSAGVDTGDEVSGSNAFTSSVDGFISAYNFETMGNGDRRLHLAINGRGGMNSECVVEMDTNTLQFRVVPPDQINDAKNEKSFAVLREIIVSFPGLKGSVQNIADALGMSYATADRQVKAALTAGVLVKAGKQAGEVGRGTQLYQLMQPADSDGNYPSA